MPKRGYRTWFVFVTSWSFQNIKHIRKSRKPWFTSLLMWFTKFKISSHKLKIESGRYTRPITPLNERICDRCDKHEIDDEIHLFNHCIHFLEARKTLFDLINESNVNFQSLSSFQNVFRNTSVVFLNINKNTRIQVYLTNQGPSRSKDSTINDSMTYTVIKMNNSMIKKKQNNQNHHVILRMKADHQALA
jgi:hypothetical protein